MPDIEVLTEVRVCLSRRQVEQIIRDWVINQRFPAGTMPGAQSDTLEVDLGPDWQKAEVTYQPVF